MIGRLFTIGHSDLPLESLIHNLKQHQVDVLCDVRSSPYSRRCPWFNRESLKTELAKTGIKYVFLGKELGGRPADVSCYDAGRVNYLKQAKTDIFQQGLARLIQGLQQYSPVLMCAEKDPLTCHRMILVSRHLRSSGIAIDHILRDGTLESNTATEDRLLRILKIQPEFSLDQTNPDGPLERAYNIQGERVAFRERDDSSNTKANGTSSAWK